MREKTEKPKPIRLEEFLYYTHIAFARGELGAVNQLSHQYPELMEQSMTDDDLVNGLHPNDWGEQSLHPVTSPSTRMTMRRLLDMVAYLLGLETAPRAYRDLLQRGDLKGRCVYNYALDRYQRDFDREEAWTDYFLALPELRRVIERRHIGSLGELEYRAAEYFLEHLRDGAKF